MLTEAPKLPQRRPYSQAVKSIQARIAARSAAARVDPLLAEAGYTRTRPLSFELRYNNGEVHTKVAVAVTSMWKEALGVEASPVAVEFNSLLDDIDRRNVGVFRMSWGGDYNAAYTVLPYLMSDFGIILPRYGGADFVALLVSASRDRARGCAPRPSRARGSSSCRTTSTRS